MALLIKNDGYEFLIRLDVMLCMSLWKESIFNYVDLWYVWSVRFWLMIPEINT